MKSFLMGTFILGTVATSPILVPSLFQPSTDTPTTTFIELRPRNSRVVTEVQRLQANHDRITAALQLQRQQLEEINGVPASEVAVVQTPQELPSIDQSVTSFVDQSQSVTGAEIRVLIAEKTALNVTTLNGFIVTDEQGNVQILPAQMDAIQVETDKIAVGEKLYQSYVWLEPQGEVFWLNDRPYRGHLLLAAQPEGLLAVNYLPLEAYLYSVLGSEMPSDWPDEALKAQAVAARSYAIAHYLEPAHQWYDLTDSELHQVYQGIEAESAASRRAVEETKGEVVSYQDKIVETMYAATDQGVQFTHAGYQSMSQAGAYELAAQGWGYQQILQYFYPGTDLAHASFESMN